jgi:hypothetical protein
MIGRLSSVSPNSGRVVSRTSRASLEAKNSPHGALCEIAVEALQYNMTDFTYLYFDILQATTLGG